MNNKFYQLNKREVIWHVTLMLKIFVFFPSISMISWAPMSISLCVQRPLREKHNATIATRSHTQLHKSEQEIQPYLWLNGRTLTATFTEAIVFLKIPKTNRNCCIQVRNWNHISLSFRLMNIFSPNTQLRWIGRRKFWSQPTSRKINLRYTFYRIVAQPPVITKPLISERKSWYKTEIDYYTRSRYRKIRNDITVYSP